MSEWLRREAHVWLSSLSEGTSPAVLEPLSFAERRRAERIRHPVAYRHFVAGRVLLRRALARYAPIAPAEWVIEETELGRPEIVGPKHAPALRFNLSHSGDLVACVVTETLDCGIDLESLDRSIEPLRIARHSFHPNEIEALERLDGAAVQELFFSLWTLKEAYLKARGSGIRLRLDSARFELTPEDAIHARFRDPDEEASWWSFRLFEPAPRHRLATAIRGGRTDQRVRVLAFDDSGEPKPWSARLLATT